MALRHDVRLLLGLSTIYSEEERGVGYTGSTSVAVCSVW
jgi:hypothetical protein